MAKFTLRSKIEYEAIQYMGPDDLVRIINWLARFHPDISNFTFTDDIIYYISNNDTTIIKNKSWLILSPSGDLNITDDETFKHNYARIEYGS